MHAFYENQKDAFIEFMKYSDEKDILVQTIIHELGNQPIKERFTFTDIWAGNGIVAENIIPFLQSRFHEFDYHFIEPSEVLASRFKETEAWRKAQYTHDFIENTRLLNSDFMLISHTLQYVEDIGKTIWKIYESLNPWGILLIVGLSQKSHDAILKKELGHTVADTTEIALRFFKKMGISFSYVSKTSHVYGMEEIADLGDFGKNYIAFLCNSPFSIIPKDHIRYIQSYIGKHMDAGVLKKEEDYIFIKKPTE